MFPHEVKYKITKGSNNWESVADSVIQATGMEEFEDSLRTGVLLGGCLCHCGDFIKPRINFNTLLGC